MLPTARTSHLQYLSFALVKPFGSIHGHENILVPEFQHEVHSSKSTTCKPVEKMASTIAAILRHVFIKDWPFICLVLNFYLVASKAYARQDGSPE